MRLATAVSFLILSLLQMHQTTNAQVKPQNRYSAQRYWEDSVHVFWTWYPNPFSPPTLKDTSKGMMCGGLTFYCDLSETVTVAFLTESDSLAYEASIVSRKPPYFDLCYWLAGPRIDPRHLPARKIRGRSRDQFKLLLTVRGRKKCVRHYGITVPKDWYCWIDDIASKAR